MSIDSPMAHRQPSASSSPLTAALSSPSTVRTAMSLGTGSLASVAVDSNNINTTNNNSIMVSKIVIDTPPTLDHTTIDALVAPKKKKYRMVAFDLDGTLLNSSHKLSPETKKYVRYLAMDCGFTIVFATGRAISTVYEHILDLNLPSDLVIPVVSSNGACAFECRVVVDVNDVNNNGQQPTVQAKPLFATPVPEPVARKTIQLARQYGHCSQYYVGDEILADPIITTTPTTTTIGYRSHLQLTKLYIDLTGAQTKYLPHDENFEQICLSKGLPSKQLVLFPPLLQDEMMAVFEREMKQNDLIAASTATLDHHHHGTAAATTSLAALKSAATIVRGNLGWFLEILHPTVCKGLGLQRLVRDHLSNMNMMTMDDCIAFGDGDNDVEFLQMAGLGIVMLNGRTVAKQAADCMTTLCHDRNGVVTTLQVLEQYGKLHFPKTPSPSPPLKSPLPSVSTASLSSSSTATSSSSDSVVVGLQVDDNNENNTATPLEESSCNRQERCDTVEF